MKKNKTGTIIKRLIIQTVVFTLLFCLIVTVYYQADYRKWALSEINAQQTINNHIIQAVENIGYEKNIIHNVVNSDRLILSSNAENFEKGQFYARITDHSGFTIVDSQKRCFFVLPAEEIDYEEAGYIYAASPRIYINESEDLISWMKAAQAEYNEKNGEGYANRLLFRVNVYAADGDYFYPTNMMTDSTHVPDVEEMFAVDKDKFESAGFELDLNSYSNSIDSTGLEIVENKEEGAVAYIVGSETNANDYLSNMNTDSKHHYVVSGVTQPDDLPAYNSLNYSYNKSFLKGDLTCVVKTSFLCSSISDENKSDSALKNYYMETFYKSNYMESRGSDVLSRILILYGIMFLISSAISVIGSLRVIAAREKEEFKKTLMNSISHDLKTPLTALRGYAESLKENLNADRKEEYANAILESSEYMDRLINGNLELLRLEDTRKTGRKETVDLVELTKGLYEKYIPSLNERGVTLNITGKYQRKVDRSLIVNAMENLVSNSVKYVNDNGEINVKETEKGFVISNTVEALPNKKPEELWESFVKGDDARSNEKGSGIGLAIAKSIFNLHKFKSSIEYTDGEEKKFEVYLS